MTPTPEKLPLWRLIAGILVLAAMAGVLIALAPLYFEDQQLGRYLQTVVAGADRPDQQIETVVLTRARQLDLPVRPDQIAISRTNGKLQVQIKYAVQMDSPIYQVVVHFHPSATAP
jgi:hypothetical protein